MGTLRAQVAADPDTSIAVQPRVETLLSASPFDTINAREYAIPRSFSFDNFMESLSGYLIGRLGPIGAQASFSRYGLGGGRGLVYLGNVLLNDPQDNHVPLALTPTTSIGELVMGRSPTRHFAAQSNIEGVIRIVEPTELEREPMATIDLSKGDHDLKQRRASFASPRKPAGIDIRYDELRNAGYSFDSRGLINGSGFGSSSTRMSEADLRGVLFNGDRYRFSLRQFETTFQGDTATAFSDNRRNGFIALAETSTRAFDAHLYGRNYKVSTRDSVTINETTRIAVRVPIRKRDDWHLVVGGSYENIFSKQDIAGGTTDDQLQIASANASASSLIGEGTLVEIAGDASVQFDYAWGWGARVAATRRLGEANRFMIEARRGFRLPNLAELFLPFHRSGSSVTTDVVGNSSLKSESSLEGTLRLYTDVGRFENDLRATALRVRNPILSVQVQSAPTPLITSSNTDAQGLQVIEDRLQVASEVWGFEVRALGGVMVALGTRDRFYAGVPSARAIGGASIGRSLFKDTSYILFGGEYIYSGSRTAGGAELSSYGVTNLKLEGRLVDAHLYLLWMNVSDEQYETVWPYLMTPRTFVYGIQWTFYN